MYCGVDRPRFQYYQSPDSTSRGTHDDKSAGLVAYTHGGAVMVVGARLLTKNETRHVLTAYNYRQLLITARPSVAGVHIIILITYIPILYTILCDVCKNIYENARM